MMCFIKFKKTLFDLRNYCLIYLANLDCKLNSKTCTNKTNFELLIIVFLLFLAQQLMELSFLFGIGASYQDLCRWDCGWYSSIIDRGYDIFIPNQNEYKNFAFFPLLPIFASLLKKLIQVSNQLALVISSKIFFFFSIFAFIKFCKKYFPEVSFFTSAMVVAFNPYAIYNNSGYTESMFFFLLAHVFT